MSPLVPVFFTTIILGFIVFLSICFFFFTCFILPLSYDQPHFYDLFSSFYESEFFITNDQLVLCSNTNSLVCIFSFFIFTVFMKSIFGNSLHLGSKCKGTFVNFQINTFPIYFGVFCFVVFERLTQFQAWSKIWKLSLYGNSLIISQSWTNCNLICWTLNNIINYVSTFWKHQKW